MSNQIVQPFALASAVAPAGTVVVGYPALPVNALSDTAKNAPNSNLGSGNFQFSDGKHTLKIGSNIYTSPKDFTLSFGNVSAGITITNRTSAAWPAGMQAALGLDLNGDIGRNPNDVRSTTRLVDVELVSMDLGSPVAAAVAGIAAVQLLGAAGNLTLNGPIVANGVANLDVPRNVTLTVATTNQSGITFTIYGFDEYGQPMVETMAGPNANTVSGIKAFARVTRVYANAAIATNGVSVGYGTTLGLPIAVRKASQVLREALDGAVATAGTFAYALQNAAATATNADVRGTYIPNSAPDGARGYSIVVFAPDPSDIGFAQFTA